MNACVSSSRSTSGIVAEQLEQFGRQGGVEVVRHISQAQGIRGLAGLLSLLRSRHRTKSCQRLAVLGDDDLFTRGSAIHQRRQLVLRFGQVEYLGHENLANLARFYYCAGGTVK